MNDSFAARVDTILDGAGHWKKWDQKEPIHMIVDPKSWPRYEQMDGATGRSKSKKKKTRIAGKI